MVDHTVHQRALGNVLDSLEDIDESALDDMTIDEVRERLNELRLGLSVEPLVAQVRAKAAPGTAVVSIARTSVLEARDLIRRLLWLGGIAVVGLLTFVGVVWGIASGMLEGEDALALAGLLLIGTGGVFVTASLAMTYVACMNALHTRLIATADHELVEEFVTMTREMIGRAIEPSAESAMLDTLRHYPSIRDYLADDVAA